MSSGISGVLVFHPLNSCTLQTTGRSRRSLAWCAHRRRNAATRLHETGCDGAARCGERKTNPLTVRWADCERTGRPPSYSPTLTLFFKRQLIADWGQSFLSQVLEVVKDQVWTRCIWPLWGIVCQGTSLTGEIGVCVRVRWGSSDGLSQRRRQAVTTTFSLS